MSNHPLSSSSSDAPLGPAEQDFFRYLLEEDDLTRITDASAFLRRVESGEVARVEGYMWTRNSVATEIREVLRISVSANLNDRERERAKHLRKLMDFIALSRGKAGEALDTHELAEKWRKHGEGVLEGSCQALLELIRQRAGHLLAERAPRIPKSAPLPRPPQNGMAARGSGAGLRPEPGNSTRPSPKPDESPKGPGRKKRGEKAPGKRRAEEGEGRRGTRFAQRLAKPQAYSGSPERINLALQRDIDLLRANPDLCRRQLEKLQVLREGEVPTAILGVLTEYVLDSSGKPIPARLDELIDALMK